MRRPAAFVRFQQIDLVRAASIVDVLLADAGGRGVDEGVLVRRAGLDPAQAQRELEARVATSRAVRANGRVFLASVVAALAARIQAEVERFHRDQPGEAGIPRETLRGRSAPRIAVELFDAVIARLTSEGKLRGAERVALASHQPAGAAADSRSREAVERRFRSAGLAPPDSAGLGAELGLSDADVQGVIRALVQDGRLVRVGDLVFHREPLAALKAAVVALRDGEPPGARVTLDVASFKARHGLSRKFAIPLLEYLDRERVTRRVGDVRIVL